MNFEAADPDRMRRAAIQKLESLERAGVTHLPRARASSQPMTARSTSSADSAAPREAPLQATHAAPAARPAPAKTVAPINESEPSTSEAMQNQPAAKRELFANEALAVAVPAAKRPAALQVIAKEVAGCVRCRELASTRTQTVFGVGNPHARLCFLGEAPGADEDRQGEPFVGRAGQLLNKIIEACTLRREDVYILNTLKCRPPGNRNPLPDELSNCRGFLDRQLEIIRPEFICCLGAVAAKALLATEAPIGKLRKRFFDYHGIRVMCTYHPAYLLRNPAAKKDVWEDMQMLMREMGIELPAAKK